MTDVQDLCADLGITYRQLDHWTRRGYLRPLVRGTNRWGGGEGMRREWPETERQVALEMGCLIRAGYRLDFAARAARALVENRWQGAAVGPSEFSSLTDD